jgi:ATP phosphoribosyltransferase regulatory subunit HisZ
LGNHLLVDMGEVRRLEYYTGLVFDIYADGLGVEVGGGGRYDHLIGRFGRAVPSTGFAFDVDRLLQLRAMQSGVQRGVEVPSGETRRRALRRRVNGGPR